MLGCVQHPVKNGVTIRINVDLLLWCGIRSHSIKLGMGLRLDSVPPNPRKGWCFYIIKQQVGSLNNLLNCQGNSLTYTYSQSLQLCVG